MGLQNPKMQRARLRVRLFFFFFYISTQQKRYVSITRISFVIKLPLDVTFHLLTSEL